MFGSIQNLRRWAQQRPRYPTRSLSWMQIVKSSTALLHFWWLLLLKANWTTCYITWALEMSWIAPKMLLCHGRPVSKRKENLRFFFTITSIKFKIKIAQAKRIKNCQDCLRQDNKQRIKRGNFVVIGSPFKVVVVKIMPSSQISRLPGHFCIQLCKEWSKIYYILNFYENFIRL